MEYEFDNFEIKVINMFTSKFYLTKPFNILHIARQSFFCAKLQDNLSIKKRDGDKRIHASVNRVMIESDNGLSPVRHQVIIWSNEDILSFRPQENEILFESFHSGKCIWKCRLQNVDRFVSASKG